MRISPIPVLTIALLAGLSAAPGAQAAGYGCSSSAIRASVLGGPALEPVTANAGGAGCKTVTSTLPDPGTALGLPLSASAVAAFTSLSGTGAAEQALAGGGIADLRVLALPSLPIALPKVTVPPVVTALPVDLSTVKASLLAGIPSILAPVLDPLVNAVPSTITVDATSAVQSALPDGALPNVDLLRVQSAMAYAGARCDAGKAALSSDAALGAITALGQTISPGQAIDPTLINTGYIDPAKVDLTKIVLPPSVQALVGSAVPNATAAVNDAIRAALTGIKVLDPTVAHIAVAPGAVTRSGNTITQQALAVTVSVAGVKVLDAVIGEATASANDVDCTPPTTPGTTVPTTTTAASLQCTTRRLVLTDVLADGDRVRLTGVADPKLAGKTVSIVFGATGHVVAHARITRAGNFATSAPMPPRSIRATNAARYTAKVGRERSINLKLQRRMILRSITNRHGKVTIVGRVVRPLARPAAAVVLRRRVSCHQMKVVGRFHPRSDGSFRIVVKAPKGPGAAVYRLTTFVRNAHGRRNFSTFTLPHAVELTD